MGNSSSSSGRGHHDDTVDYGALVPQGVYSGPQDWNKSVVSQLISSRKLAPFYRPLEEYNETWDDDQILAARKVLPDSDHSDSVTRTDHSSSPSHSNSSKSKRPGPLKEPAKAEAQIYRGAVECPICFLYYPPNINRSRCCDQAICTECFVQIKRSEPTTTHLVSEPAACPYCVQENFGVIYTPPVWRAGLGSEHGLLSETRSRSPTDPPSSLTHKRRQKSYGADSPDVVLIDHIRPDWEAKLEAVRAAVARRANRRIIMRQVGDRLIPVGVTSGRVHTLSPEEAAAAAAASVENGSRRSRRRGGPSGGDALEQFMGMTGPDLEELMLMEAMRLSLLEHEEQQRKEAEEKRKREAAEAAARDAGSGPSMNKPSTSSTAAPVPGPSTLASRSSFPISGSSSLSTSPPSPLPSSSAANHSQDNSSPSRRSWSLSRSRTPSPLPPNPVRNLPVSEENQPAWRNQNDGPRPFGTLNAVLTTTSTATSVPGSRGGSRSRSVTPDPQAASDVVAGKTTTLLNSQTLPHTNAGVTSLPSMVDAEGPRQTLGTSEPSTTSMPMYSDSPLPPIPKEETSAELSPGVLTEETAISPSTSISSSTFYGSLDCGAPSRTVMLNGSYGPSTTSNATSRKGNEIATPTVHVEDVSR